jgi:hypothetical protein
MKQPEKSKLIKVDPDRELLALSVLLHCRTVVEKQKSNFVTTGVMTNVDGELFEVEIHEFDQFELGETVKLMIYSPAGIQSFNAVVFAKYGGAIALLQPPDLNKRFKERREHSRIETKGKAQISHMLDQEGNEQQLTEPFLLDVHDVSLSGISFSGSAVPYLTQKMKVKGNVDIGISFNCNLEVMRQERQGNIMVCGAKMKIDDEDMMRALRALILRLQVEKNAQIRLDSLKARTFNN